MKLFRLLPAMLIVFACMQMDAMNAMHKRQQDIITLAQTYKDKKCLMNEYDKKTLQALADYYGWSSFTAPDYIQELAAVLQPKQHDHYTLKELCDALSAAIYNHTHTNFPIIPLEKAFANKRCAEVDKWWQEYFEALNAAPNAASRKYITKCNHGIYQNDMRILLRVLDELCLLLKHRVWAPYAWMRLQIFSRKLNAFAMVSDKLEFNGNNGAMSELVISAQVTVTSVPGLYAARWVPRILLIAAGIGGIGLFAYKLLKK